jgi:hypothetical protein
MSWLPRHWYLKRRVSYNHYFWLVRPSPTKVHIWKLLGCTYQPTRPGIAISRWSWSRLRNRRSCRPPRPIWCSAKARSSIIGRVYLRTRCSFSLRRFAQRRPTCPLDRRWAYITLPRWEGGNWLCNAVAFVMYCLSPGSQSRWYVNSPLLHLGYWRRNEADLPLTTSLGTAMPAACNTGRTARQKVSGDGCQPVQP